MNQSTNVKKFRKKLKQIVAKMPLVPEPELNQIQVKLYIAAWNGSLEGVKLCLLTGARINKKQLNGPSYLYDYGFSPMHYAVCSGNLEVVKFLHQNGGKIDVKDCKNRTPIGLAVERGHDDIVEYFNMIQLENLTLM